MSQTNGDASSSSKSDHIRAFVSESQINERRETRQKEWEKTRKADDPLEAPEEQYDPRPLYDRLKDQQIRKQEEYEESKKLKHLIKGLDNDEISFLEMVDHNKMEVESKILEEEMKEIEEYKMALQNVGVNQQEKRLNDLKSNILMNKSKKSNSDVKNARKSQSELLANVIRKRVHSDNSDDQTKCDTNKRTKNDDAFENDDDTDQKSPDNSQEFQSVKCIGVLPGLGQYCTDSSDSENSSNSDDFNEIKEFHLLVRSNRSKDNAIVKCVKKDE